jgi:hypothetical protein
MVRGLLQATAYNKQPKSAIKDEPSVALSTFPFSE